MNENYTNINTPYYQIEEKPKKAKFKNSLNMGILVSSILSSGVSPNMDKIEIFKQENPLFCELYDNSKINIDDILNNNGLYSGFQIKEKLLETTKQETFSIKELELIKFIGTIGSFEEKVTKLAESKTKYELTLIKKRYSKKIYSGETYLKHSMRYFIETESVDKRRGIANIPKDIRKLLARIIPGLITQESKYRKDAINERTNALGATQVLPENIKMDEEIFLASFYLQVKESYKNFEKIWSIFSNGAFYEYKGNRRTIPKLDFEQFKNTYGLSDNEFNEFIVLCMINAYNTGESRILRILHKFHTEVPQKIANKRNEITPEGLFNLMSEIAYKNEWSKWYKEESFEYTGHAISYAIALGTLRKNIEELDTFMNVSSKYSWELDIHKTKENSINGLSELNNGIYQYSENI